jgi:copper transport protein
VFVVVDAVHFAAVGAWVGGLAALYLLRGHDGVDAGRFSRTATRALPIVVVTGAAQGLHLMEGIDDLTGTRYGQLLLAKVAMVAVLALAGAAARRRIVSRSAAPIASILRFDLVLVLAVLAVTSVLVGTPPGTSDNPADRTFTSTQIQADVLVDLTVVPTRVGAAEVHVILTPPGGALAPALDVAVRFSLPDRGIPAIPVSMVELGPNHWSGIVQFPYGGSWSMRVQVEDAPGSTIAYDAVVEVAG